jgi:hypothetical protein
MLTLRYNTIQDPCVVDIVDNFVSRSHLITCKLLRRQHGDLVSNLQHNVLPGAHIDESHPLPNAFVQRSSLLDSSTSNPGFCSRKPLANTAWGIDSDRSRWLSFERCECPRTLAIPPGRSERMLGKV